MRVVALGVAICLALLAAGCTQSPGADRFTVDADLVGRLTQIYGP